jgi:hypothetical protein
VAGVLLGLLLPAAPAVALLAASLALVASVPLAVRGPKTVRATTGSARTPLALGPSKGDRRTLGVRKLLTRFLPTAVAGFPVTQAFLAPSPTRLAAAALATAAVAWVIHRYRRRGPDRSACLACPDGPPGARCPGLAPIARRERAFSRLAGRWISAALPFPGAEAAADRPAPRPPPAAAPAPTPEAPLPRGGS